MHFTFQESTIWDANKRVDPNRKPVRIKAQTLEKAKRRLPRPDMGREWILIHTEENGKKWKMFRRAGVEYEAAQLDRENVNDLAAWCQGVAVEEKSPVDSKIIYPGINVPTAEGMQRLSMGMWLVKGKDGVFQIWGLTAFPNNFEEV